MKFTNHFEKTFQPHAEQNHKPKRGEQIKADD